MVDDPDEMTEPTPRIDAARATGAFRVEHCDIPEEMTLCEWRRLKAAEAAALKRPRLLKRVFGKAA
jgi:hypothetical protein